MARKPRPRISEDFFDATFGAADSTAADSTAADSTAADSTAADSTAADSTAPAAHSSDASPDARAPNADKRHRHEPSESKAQEPSPIEASQNPVGPDNSKPRDKIRTTLYISRELYEQARWLTLNFPDHARSVSQLMESALRAEVGRITKAEGAPIGRHIHGLPGGRPKEAS